MVFKTIRVKLSFTPQFTQKINLGVNKAKNNTLKIKVTQEITVFKLLIWYDSCYSNDVLIQNNLK